MSVYLDNAATSQPHPSVIRAMTQAFEEGLGNPSSGHALGAKAKQKLEESRAVIAEALGVEPQELYFTSGGTESNNLALHGACWAACPDKPGTLVTSTLEHPSVTKPVRNLKRMGWRAEYIEALDGNLDVEQLEACLNEHTTMISIMGVQNELGYVFPLKEIAYIRQRKAPQAVFHTDLVQAFGKTILSIEPLGCDLVTINAHKIGGPVGIGALYVKRGTKMFTMAHGGGQERGLRSGTEALPLVRGFAAAVSLAAKQVDKNRQHAQSLGRYLRQACEATLPNCFFNSHENGSPYIHSLVVPGIKNKKALAYLSERGIYVSTASACEDNINTVEPGTWRPKHPLALQAAGISLRQAKSTLRISFSFSNSQEDIDLFVATLKEYCDTHQPSPRQKK